MFINRRKLELNMKIVYYGPAMSGKTTNLQFVHANTPQGLCTDLVSLKTREDRTIFFDYLQLELGRIAGMKPRFNLYTVPGQVYYGSTRKLVLQGADGIVFVADSDRRRLQDNVTALRDLATYMRELNIDPRAVPLIIQFNKRDLKTAVPEEELCRLFKITRAVPTFFATALEGPGVFETLKAVINAVMARVQQQMNEPTPDYAAVSVATP